MISTRFTCSFSSNLILHNFCKLHPKICCNSLNIHFFLGFVLRSLLILSSIFIFILFTSNLPVFSKAFLIIFTSGSVTWHLNIISWLYFVPERYERCLWVSSSVNGKSVPWPSSGREWATEVNVGGDRMNPGKILPLLSANSLLRGRMNW